MLSCLHPGHSRLPELQPASLRSSYIRHSQLLSCSVGILSLSHFRGARQLRETSQGTSFSIRVHSREFAAKFRVSDHGDVARFRSISAIGASPFIPRSKGVTRNIPRSTNFGFQLPDYQITRLLTTVWRPTPPCSSQDLKDLPETSQGMLSI